jgi:hypothetical protein
LSIGLFILFPRPIRPGGLNRRRGRLRLRSAYHIVHHAHHIPDRSFRTVQGETTQTDRYYIVTSLDMLLYLGYGNKKISNRNPGLYHDPYRGICVCGQDRANLPACA